MIKVNLLKDHTVRVRNVFAKPTVSRMGLVLLAVFLLAAAAMALWTRHVNRQIDEGVKSRDELRMADEELKRLNAEIARYSKLKAQLDDRTHAIDNLQQERTGPVLLLNAVIRSIPQNAEIWLTSLTQKSDSIKIIGQTPQAEVIPDLMINLTASGIFATVDLELIERSNDTSRFSLFCTSAKKSQAE